MRAMRWFVDPVCKVCCHLPWLFSKYVMENTLVFPYFVNVKLVSRALPPYRADRQPLGAYARWIARREFDCFRQVAFDQIGTPQTLYFRREDIDAGQTDLQVEPGSAYIVMRNGKSWKFGERRAA